MPTLAQGLGEGLLPLGKNRPSVALAEPEGDDKGDIALSKWFVLGSPMV